MLLRHVINQLKPALIAVVVSAALLACEQESSSPAAPPLQELIPQAARETVDTYAASESVWQAGQAFLFKALDEINRLHMAVDALLGEPTEQNLRLAREQWQQAFVAFTAAQPLLRSELSVAASNLPASISHWPFYPGFIDSFSQYRDSGIVNAIDTPLNLSVVRTYHQQYEANELLLGFYPMAYLLWSEYESRPVTDLLPLNTPPERFKNASIKLTQLPQNRRRQLLRLQSEWLLIDVKALYDSWVEGELYDAYHQLLPDERLRVITDSLLLSLERMLVSAEGAAGLPGRFIRQNTQGGHIILSSVERYYFNYRLADYWLIPKERERVQVLFTQLQQFNETLLSDDDSLMALRTLIALLSPDAPLMNNPTPPQ